MSNKTHFLVSRLEELLNSHLNLEAPRLGRGIEQILVSMVCKLERLDHGLGAVEIRKVFPDAIVEACIEGFDWGLKEYELLVQKKNEELEKLTASGLAEYDQKVSSIVNMCCKVDDNTVVDVLECVSKPAIEKKLEIIQRINGN